MIDLIKQALDFFGLGGWPWIVVKILLGSGLAAWAWKTGTKILKWLQQKKLAKDLHPYYSPLDVKNATEFYVPTQSQNIAPSQELEPGHTHIMAMKNKLIPFFLNTAFKFNQNDHQRFFIVLADSGMGKTTFMINLYLRYKARRFGHRFKIKLFPLGYKNIDKKIEEIKDKENTILLLDAFDEDPNALDNHQKRMSDILGIVEPFRKVVITCRTQFFPSAEEEPGETGILKFGSEKGFHRFMKFYLSPFNPDDIRKYLRKKFSIFQLKNRKKAYKIVERSPNLMVRPMLLSYIDHLLASGRDYKYPHEIYEELIKQWIEREANRYHEKDKKKFRVELNRFSMAVAIDIYNNRESRGGLVIPAGKIIPLAVSHDIKLEEMEMKSRSLMNRNAIGEYKFAHKSILEYLLAIELCYNYQFKKNFNFEGMDQAKLFYDDIWKIKTLEFLTQSKLKGSYRCSGSHENSDFSKLKIDELVQLEYLNLEDNKLTHVTPLAELKGLTELQLYNNKLTDVSPLVELKGLTHLEFQRNQLTDVTPLRELKRLTYLNLRGNLLADVTSLAELKGLNTLYLNNNQLTDVTPLTELKGLTHLSIRGNQLTDVTPLAELKGLTKLNLQGNRLTDVTPLTELKGLTHLELQRNQLTDVTPLAELKGLVELWLNGNQLTDVTPLAELKQLKKLYIDQNQKVTLTTQLSMLEKEIPELEIITS